jgi:phage antirepressor YoqD-like protein
MRRGKGMKELAINGDKRMTVREVAEALGVHIDTIHSWIDKLYPDIKTNGITTYLNEEQVTRIKQAMNQNYSLRSVPKVTTALEMAEKTIEVIEFYMAETARLQAEATATAPKVESFDALMRSERTMSITEAAKHFGLHAKAEVFPYLREHGYLNHDDTPSQAAIAAGYLALRRARCPDGAIRAQAVVMDCQLETWRKRVVPQVKGWKAWDGMPVSERRKIRGAA